MDREEALEIIKNNCSFPGTKLWEACAVFIPELRENKEERIRKYLIELVNGDFTGFPSDLSRNDVIDYLKRRKGEEKAPISSGDDEDILLGLDRALTTLTDVRGSIHGDDAIFECDHAIKVLNEILKGRYAVLKAVQWTGENLKEVVEFTGKNPKFDEYFKSWEEFEKYVHSHNNIFKIFNANGSHLEVRPGAWIIRTPDGYNTVSRATFVQKPVAPWDDNDSDELNNVYWCLEYPAKSDKSIERAKRWIRDRLLCLFPPKQEVDLVKVLKNLPKEFPLYSPMYGKLWLAEVDEENGIITCYKNELAKDDTRAVLSQENTVSFYFDGTTGDGNFNVTKDRMLFLLDEPYPQPKQPKAPEWSKEEEAFYNRIVRKIRRDGWAAGITKEMVQFLEKHRPDFRYKPAEGQMTALANVMYQDRNLSAELESLYNDLIGYTVDNKRI